MTLQEIMLARIKETHTPAYRVQNQSMQLRRPHDSVSKAYTCVDSAHARKFVERLMELQDTTYHGAKIVVEDNNVLVETFTRGVNCVTELDHQFMELTDDAFDTTR